MSPTVPSEATCTCGVKAGLSPGDWSIRIGVDQWSPPSVDSDNAIFALPVGLKRPSCQTA